jgi:hypothetical protein
VRAARNSRQELQARSIDKSKDEELAGRSEGLARAGDEAGKCE